MTPDELKEKLTQDDWKFGASPDPRMGVDWYAWKPLPTEMQPADCVLNEKPPSFTLNPASFELNGTTFSSVQFQLTGETSNNDWVQFTLYSVPMNEAFDRIPRAMAKLTAAWNAAASLGGV